MKPQSNPKISKRESYLVRARTAGYNGDYADLVRLIVDATRIVSTSAMKEAYRAGADKRLNDCLRGELTFQALQAMELPEAIRDSLREGTP